MIVLIDILFNRSIINKIQVIVNKNSYFEVNENPKKNVTSGKNLLLSVLNR
jgi:hypothetical protein